MKSLGLTVMVGMAVSAAMAFAAPAQADDQSFNQTLHSFGIYGPMDYVAYLGKIACHRLDTGLDKDAFQSTAFIKKNLDRDTTTQQHWEFLQASINEYCPEEQPVLAAAAGQH